MLNKRVNSFNRWPCFRFILDGMYPLYNPIRLPQLCKFCDVEASDCKGTGTCESNCSITSICADADEICVAIWYVTVQVIFFHIFLWSVKHLLYASVKHLLCTTVKNHQWILFLSFRYHSHIFLKWHEIKINMLSLRTYCSKEKKWWF